jgi:hypothetical protein
MSTPSLESGHTSPSDPQKDPLLEELTSLYEEMQSELREMDLYSVFTSVGEFISIFTTVGDKVSSKYVQEFAPTLNKLIRASRQALKRRGIERAMESGIDNMIEMFGDLKEFEDDNDEDEDEEIEDDEEIDEEKNHT